MTEVGRNIAALVLDELSAHGELAAQLTDGQSKLPTACPGWNTRDVLAHVSSTERMLEGLSDPAHELSGNHEYLKTPMSVRIEVPIDLRRSMTLDALKIEFADMVRRRRATLRAPDYDLDAQIASPFGMKPAGWVLTRRLVDLVVHEQDILRALHQPMRLGAAAPVALAALTDRLSDIFNPGQSLLGATVRLTITGIGAQSIDLGHSGARRAAATITVDAQTAFLLLAGRAQVSELTIAVEGDHTQASIVLDHAVVT
ncbi:MAG: maleylpyruvate isomerase family mycothiol-dependent enzyme [Antricoccus sp.]